MNINYPNQLISFLGSFASNEQLINRLAETKPIKRAAQLTAYGIIRMTDAGNVFYMQKEKKLGFNPVSFRIFMFILFSAKKQLTEFEKSGGLNKMQQVTKSDINEAAKITKEMLTYDIPHMFKQIIRNMKKKM